MPPPIAIVGVSVELPSGSYSAENLDHESFFEFLLSSGESYEPFPHGRFNIEAWKGEGIGKVHVAKGSFLKNIDTFDNVEFGISSKDAQSMSPAARKLLENSFLALLDSGINYRMKNIGVFTSGTSIDLMNVSEPDEFDARGSFAGYPAMIANRISNHLDLLGPSLPLDTACSSTLTAMHLAVQAIANGDCEAAVVGGCQLNHRFIDWITYSQGSLLAKDGKCKPFDSHADGFARAEGCAVVVVKPLEAALRDHDHIYATILGTAINSTGAAAAPGAPVAEAQRDAMVQAFERAGKSPREVDFVELHATGTAKGDPTEANWVGERFHREDDLLVGSVKANIGHTEITAFLASLSKVISIFDKKVIPPQVNIKELNPAIKWDEYHLRVPFAPTPLPCRSGDKSLVAIACSGIGGSNGHVVLESPPPIVPISICDVNENRPVLLMAGALSSRSATSLSQSIQKDFVKFTPDLPGLSTVLGRRSKQTTWRTYAIGGVEQTSLAEFSAPQHNARNPNSLIYVFSGQGPQHKDMGRELFRSYPVFRETVLELDEVFKRATGTSIIHDYGLFDDVPPVALPEIWPIALVLPSIAVFQIALFDLMKSLGLSPDFVIGHSAGETAVLYASGAAPKEMALELAIIRGRSFTPIEELGGSMAAISCSPEELEDLLREHRKVDGEKGIVELACYNAPGAVAIAGEEVAIDDVVRLAESRGKFARKIRTKVPFHSSMMEKAKELYTTALGDLFARYPGPHVPEVPVYSTFTGELFEGSFDANYFWNNTVSAVRFTQAMDAIRDSIPSASFVELSPHPVLSSYIATMISETSIGLHSVQRAKKGKASTELVDILHVCGKLTVAGHNSLDFTVLNNRSCSEFDLALPAYPFSRKQYPLYPDTPGVHKTLEVPHGPLNYSYLRMNKETHPTLAEHVIRGEPIMPAAGYLEMALEFGASTLMNVNLRSIFSLSSEKPVKVDVKLDGAFWSVKSLATSKARKDAVTTSSERLHADGYLSFETPAAVGSLDIHAIRRRCINHVGSAFYPSLSYFSAYGPRFQRVTNLFYSDQEALASIKGTDATLTSDGKYLLHPAILDACIQVAAYKPFHGDFDPNVYYLPAHVDALIVHQRSRPGYFPRHIYAHVQLKKWVPDGMHYDISLVDDAGVRLCSFIGLQLAKHRIVPLVETNRPLEPALQPVFHAARALSKPSYKPADRSDLFGTLDKMTIRAKMRQKMGPPQCIGGVKLPSGISQEWPAYFESLETTTTTSPSHGPQFDEAIKCLTHSLRTALDDLEQSGLRVARTLIVSNVKPDTFRTATEDVFQAFPSLYVDLFVDDRQSSHTLPKVASGMVRPVHTTFTESGLQGLPEEPFDVIVFFNITEGNATPQSIAKAAHSHLVSGGTFLMTERTFDAWDLCSLGTMWYDATFGAPLTTETYTSTLYLDSLKAEGINTLRVHSSEDSDPFHITIESQKKPWSAVDIPAAHLFDPAEDYAYEFACGSELDLQWELSGLNEAQDTNVWLIATEGRHGAAAQGVARALRREYISWTIRLIIFPTSYDEDMRQDFLQHLPLELQSERDIIVSVENPNRLLVPRIAPVHALPDRLTDEACDTTTSPTITPANHVLIRPLSHSHQGAFSGILATIVDGNGSGLMDGSLVVGVTELRVEEHMVLDAATVVPVPDDYKQQATSLAALVPGFVLATLAVGVSTLSQPSRLTDLRVLITHCDALVGQSATTFSSLHGIQHHRLERDASLLTIANLQRDPYDIIISGYTNKLYLQVLATLLRPSKGRLFSWDDEKDGLAALLRKDPCAIGDALRCAISSIAKHPQAVEMLPTTLPTPKIEPQRLPKVIQGASFDADKAYLLLGGIGTIGAHLSLYLYQRGARRIVLTSRSGKKSIASNPNLVVRRMFAYLEARDDLELSFRALDGTDALGMKALVEEVGPSQIGGCVILTAVTSDGIFRHLTEDDFKLVFASKLGVLETFKDVADHQALDFIVSFTSVSGLTGFGGQTNYGSANTALEYEMSTIPNGFAFICPGVQDSTLMLAGTDKSNEIRLASVMPLSVSAEDMIRWFDDAMFRFQNGQRVVGYVPDLDWEGLEGTLGVPQIGKHLVPSRTTEAHTDVDDTERMIEIIKGVLAIPSADFSAEVPLTAYGIDSLSASRISFLLRPFLEISQIQLLADITFNDIHQLATSDVSETTEKNEGPVKPKATKGKGDFMNEMLAKYSAGLEAAPSSSSTQTSAQDEVVLLTGTTGTLGSNVLSQLLHNAEIKLVYAVNRVQRSGVSLLEKQRNLFTQQGLDLSVLESPKLVLLEADLTANDLGLDSAIVEKLLSSVTHVIHNAWAVDFATSLADHEDLIHGTRNLLDFALRSTLPSPPSLSYISTIGVYQNFKSAPNSTWGQEAPVLDPKVSIQTGYIESKWVAERLFQLAAERSGLRTNVIRVGLLTGGVNGSWDPSQWMPAIVQSAAYLGCLPASDDTVSWVPVDMAAAAIVDMRSTTETLHLIHPKPTTWNSVMQPLSKLLGVPLVPYVEWFSRLESSARDSGEDVPSSVHVKYRRAALKLIHFYRIGLIASAAEGTTESCGLLARVDTEKGVAASETLRAEDIAPLGDHDAEKWVDWWREIGFLPSSES